MHSGATAGRARSAKETVPGLLRKAPPPQEEIGGDAVDKDGNLLLAPWEGLVIDVERWSATAAGCGPPG